MTGVIYQRGDKLKPMETEQGSAHGTVWEPIDLVHVVNAGLDSASRRAAIDSEMVRAIIEVVDEAGLVVVVSVDRAKARHSWPICPHAVQVPLRQRIILVSRLGG